MSFFKATILTALFALPTMQAQAQTQTSTGVRYTCQSEWSFERLEMIEPKLAANGQYQMKITDITSSEDVPLVLKGTIQADKFDVVASEKSLFSDAEGTRLTGKKNANGEWTIVWSMKEASNGDSQIRLLCD